MLPSERPLAPFGRRSALVVERLTYGAYVVLRCLDADGPVPRAGQFYMLASAERWGGGEGERPYLPRAFSVLRARKPADSGVTELEFLIDDVGPGTKRLCELDRDDGLLLVGPLGTPFSAPRPGRRPLLVGGGVGIAPLAILQDELGAAADGTGADPIPALLGFRDRERADGAVLLTGARVATDDGSVGHHGLVTELLEAELEEAADEIEIYACGPPAMLEAVRSVCAEHSIPAQLALESGMACGFGACFGCVVATKDGYVRLCLDGPVLDAARLETAAVAGAPH
jgi:NAD(P)H-flavin reductase